ncbi:cyclin-dependent kinase 11B-like [Babylonia areolata]|uniref:cyclin-dependent kinase 11B-like n=1 Tax=Babylonia areolata TaxID=304850 RepID=UPI003FD3663C
MSDSSSSSSPDSSFEQGELKSSPEQYKKRDRAMVITTGTERQVSLVSSSQVLDVDKDSVDVIEIPSDDGEIERDALHIKPPQSQAGPVRREKSHKRKHKAERRRDKQKQSREVDRERDRHRHAMEHHVRMDRNESKDRIDRSFKDAREIVRERQKEKRQKEVPRDDWAMRDDRDIGKEARKRKESLKERERLENMEREKQRERRLREEREKADKQRRKEEERRLQQRAEDARPRDKGPRMDRHMERGSDRSLDRSNRERGRGSKEQRHQRSDRDRSDIRDRDRPRKNEDERSRLRGPRSQDLSSHSEHHEEERKPASPEQLEEEEEEEEEGEEEIVEPPSPHASIHSEEEDKVIETPPQQKSSSSEDESESEHSSVSREGGHKPPLKSKFENESDIEKGENQRERSGSSSSPTGPEMEEVQVTPEDSPVAMREDLPVYLPAVQGCRNVEEFHCMNRIEEGTYGVVYRARDRKTGEIVALKRLKMEKEKEGFPITSLREINTLLKAQHTNIVTVREIVVGSNMDKIYIVMDYVEHDLKSLMETMKHPFSVGEVKTLMLQLLRAVAHLHDNWILHRDLKTSNLLLSHKGILKVGDFGLAREYGSPLKAYTPIVVTLWYRAPELLLCCKEYSKPIDMWSVGCIHAELLTMKALWPGKSDIDQLNKIFKDLGSPNEKIWEGLGKLPGWQKTSFQHYPQNTIRNRFGPQFSDLGFDLLNRLLTYDPTKRIDAKSAVDHEWFSESPLPTDPSMFPTWPARSEQPGRRHNSPKPPSGGKAYAKLMAEEVNLQASGFHMDTAAKGASAQGACFQLKF